MSIDPVTFMDTGDPSYFNRYSYTANDPINLVDPNGQKFEFAEGSSKEFKENVASAFAKISESKEGAAAIQTLAGSSHIITLKESTGGIIRFPQITGQIHLIPI